MYLHNEHDDDGGAGHHDDEHDDDGGHDVGGFVCVSSVRQAGVIYLCKGPESKGLSGQGLQLIMHSCSWCAEAILLRPSCHTLGSNVCN